jgi:hypothetical protein
MRYLFRGFLEKLKGLRKGGYHNKGKVVFKPPQIA